MSDSLEIKCDRKGPVLIMRLIGSAGMPEIETFDVSASEGDYFRCALTPRNGLDLRSRVFDLVRERGWPLRELTRNRHSLEDIYVQLTRPGDEEEA